MTIRIALALLAIVLAAMAYPWQSVSDRWIIGGAVDFLGQFGVFTGTVNRSVDEDTLNGGFDRVSESIRDTGRVYSRAQTGEAHGYLRVIAVAFIVLALVLVMGGVR